MRGDGGYVVAPPSIHPSGAQYSWAVSRSPDDCDIADAPNWLLDLVHRGSVAAKDKISPNNLVADDADRVEAQKRATELAGAVAGADPGQRNEALNRSAFHCGQWIGSGCLQRGNVEALLLCAAEANGLTADDGRRAVTNTIRSGVNAGIREPKLPWRPGIHHLTDVGNAERFVGQHGGKLRYCPEWKRWLVWTGVRWETDTSKQVVEWAKQTALSIYDEAKEASTRGDPNAQAIGKWAVKSEHVQRIKAMLELAQSRLPISPGVLDNDPWKLNVLNGTICLRSGELAPHNKHDFITQLADVEFDATAQCPSFVKAVGDAASDDKDVADYLQQQLGYALTGDISEECLFVWYGTGRNGKGTIAETIMAAMGSYATTVPANTFTSIDRDGPRNDLAKIRAARFVVASEVNEGRRLDEALVKNVTGGDTVSARFLYGEFFDFRPQFKIVLQTNHRPKIEGLDEGIWSRLRLLPFQNQVPKASMNKNLKAYIRDNELPGVLAWLVRGCLAWQRHGGLKEPELVEVAMGEYRTSEDIVGEFLTDMLITADVLGEPTRQVFVPCGEVVERFAEWCKVNGHWEIKPARLRKSMSAKGYVGEPKNHHGRSVRVYYGIRQRQQDDPLNHSPRLKQKLVGQKTSGQANAK